MISVDNERQTLKECVRSLHYNWTALGSDHLAESIHVKQTREAAGKEKH